MRYLFLKVFILDKQLNTKLFYCPSTLDLIFLRAQGQKVLHLQRIGKTGQNKVFPHLILDTTHKTKPHNEGILSEPTDRHALRSRQRHGIFHPHQRDCLDLCQRECWKRVEGTCANLSSYRLISSEI